MDASYLHWSNIDNFEVVLHQNVSAEVLTDLPQHSQKRDVRFTRTCWSANEKILVGLEG